MSMTILQGLAALGLLDLNLEESEMCLLGNVSVDLVAGPLQARSCLSANQIKLVSANWAAKQVMTTKAEVARQAALPSRALLQVCHHLQQVSRAVCLWQGLPSKQRMTEPV